MSSRSQELVDRPEFQLLLRCLPDASNTAPLRDIDSLCSRVIDWEFLLSEADRHGLAPLLARRICDVAAVPPSIAEKLRSLARSQVSHSLMLTGRLVNLMNLFEAAGVDAIPYKGPTLAALAYGDPACRPSVDLDILVRPEQLDLATNTLVSAGFRQAEYVSEHQRKLLLNCTCEHEFTSPAGDFSVEIHWRVVSREYGFEFPDTCAWNRLQSVPIGASSLRTLSSEDLLLALAAHGTRHLWIRLLWIADIASMTQRCRLDWERLIARADEFRMRRVLLLGLSLANELFSAATPASVVSLIERDRTVKRLQNRVVHDFIHDGFANERISRHTFLLRTRALWSDKYRYVRHIAFTPQIGDFADTTYTGGNALRDGGLRLRGIARRMHRKLIGKSDEPAE